MVSDSITLYINHSGEEGLYATHEQANGIFFSYYEM